jgi:hypothetical protein
MHLSGRHEFSTFRRTLGSILATADSLAAIDEDALTAWMRRHLVVRTAVHPNPDVLGELEAAVLRVIDPPLNLRGMTDTPRSSGCTRWPSRTPSTTISDPSWTVTRRTCS